ESATSYAKDQRRKKPKSKMSPKGPKGLSELARDGNFQVMVNARDITRPKPGIKLYKPEPSKPEEVMPLAEFFDLFRSILEIETKEMSFDYFLMHRVCWNLLRRINELCRPQLTKLLGAGYLPEEHHLIILPEYIFQTIANYPQPDDERLLVPIPLLTSTSKAFQEMFKHEANVVFQQSPKLGIELDIGVPTIEICGGLKQRE
ncbi:MAG: hypothetical protein Q9226_008587, partial [Calogaya cf. arnoldii]